MKLKDFQTHPGVPSLTQNTVPNVVALHGRVYKRLDMTARSLYFEEHDGIVNIFLNYLLKSLIFPHITFIDIPIFSQVFHHG